MMAHWKRPQIPNQEILSSNLLMTAVETLGKALYPHCLVPLKGLKAFSPLAAYLQVH